RARRVRARLSGSGPAGSDAARPRRSGGLPAVARVADDGAYADVFSDRATGRGDTRAWARARRGRLRREAVQHSRAAAPDPRRAQARDTGRDAAATVVGPDARPVPRAERIRGDSFR